MANLIFKTFSNGIRDVKTGKFYPFRTNSFTTPGTILPAKVNVRYYVHSITLVISTVEADAGTAAYIQGVQFLETLALARYEKTTLKINQESQFYPVNTLLDRESSVTLTAADISTVAAIITWAEVDDFDG